MSFVNIKTAGPTLAPEQVRRLQIRMMELMASALHYAPGMTSILVEQPSISGWAVGGRAAIVAAYMEAKIIAGSATSAQKTDFIRAPVDCCDRCLAENSRSRPTSR